LGDAVARTRGWQVDHAAVEPMSVGQPLAHVVVDGDVGDLGFEHLTAPTRRRPEHDVAAGIFMTDRRHLARLAAEDIEHAYAIFAGGDLREGAEAAQILEVSNDM